MIMCIYKIVIVSVSGSPGSGLVPLIKNNLNTSKLKKLSNFAMVPTKSTKITNLLQLGVTVVKFLSNNHLKLD